MPGLITIRARVGEILAMLMGVGDFPYAHVKDSFQCRVCEKMHL